MLKNWLKDKGGAIIISILCFGLSILLFNIIRITAVNFIKDEWKNLFLNEKVFFIGIGAIFIFTFVYALRRLRDLETSLRESLIIVGKLIAIIGFSLLAYILFGNVYEHIIKKVTSSEIQRKN